MSTTLNRSDVLEMIYARSLEAVAMGASRSETLGDLKRNYGRFVNYGDIEREAVAAFMDATKQGVEKEDIDPSWYVGQGA
jgi:hypothetical protein